MAKIKLDGITFSKKFDAICYYLITTAKSVKQVAKKVGCSETLISQTRKNTPIATMEIIAKNYINANINVFDIMSGAKNTTKKTTKQPKTKKHTSAKEEALKALKLLKNDSPTPKQTPVTKKKKTTKKKAVVIKSEPVEPVNVDRCSEITKYVIGYAQREGQLRFKDIETYQELTKDEFISSAKDIFREYSVKYVYLECYYANGEHYTEVMYRNPKSNHLLLNKIWN